MLVQAREEAQSAKGQVEAVRSDNLALLERLKYVQGYQNQSRPRKSEPLCYAVPFALCSVYKRLWLQIGRSLQHCQVTTAWTKVHLKSGSELDEA